MSARREFLIVFIASAILTAALTYPIAFKIGRIGRVDSGDGQFSIWNVAWVARTLVVDPAHVFDANIFYPHRGTLAYSENNLGAGALAIPVYWATRNPYAALNFVVLLAFSLSAIGMYYLVRHLTGDRRAAAISAISFAFCPSIFARTAQIQLLMTAGLPFTMLAFHRVVDRPSLARGAVLGAAMAAQALCCGYYGVFDVLLVGYAMIVVAMNRSLWKDVACWLALAAAAVVAVALVLPAFLPYIRLARVEGAVRSLEQANSFRANWSAYLASSSYAHAWMLQYLPRWSDVLFPGFVTLTFGVVGGWVARRQLNGELTSLYGGVAVLAFWASFGPPAGLYSVLYSVVPFFAWLRAPSRFGLLVVFALSVLTGFAVSDLLRWTRHANAVCAVLAIAVTAELVVPLNIPVVDPLEPEYRTLAALPPGAVIEMPFYFPEVGLFQHTRYMLASTSHWKPLVNGYSDYIPPDFYQNVEILKFFPRRDAFKILEPNKVRYAVIHLYGYNDEDRRAELARLKEFEKYLRLLYDDSYVRIYEILGYPA
jgi:hypothetical protein